MFPDKINDAEPQILFIDMNKAFASTEQQANKFLRNRPVAITNRASPNPSIIAFSAEAKELGVRDGMSAREARAIVPDITILESDVPKYLHMHGKMVRIMSDYSPKIKLKSVDEGLIDFTGVHRKQTLQEIGMEIKRRIKEELGDYMTVNIGIATSQWLAKLASNLNKPDGLTTIDHSNLLDVYSKLSLTDLPYIAEKHEARLMSHEIMNPTDFFNADWYFLWRQVFGTINGYYWHFKLRGWELDDFEEGFHSVQKQYRLRHPSAEDEKLLYLLHHLCDAAAQKLRFMNAMARGVEVILVFQSGGYMREKKKFKVPFRFCQDIYQKALYLFNRRPKHLIVVHLNISCYGTSKFAGDQLSLFEDVAKLADTVAAMNEVNDDFGKFTAIYANQLLGKLEIKQKLPMGISDYAAMLNS